jgi:prevent-host-death family protein
MIVINIHEAKAKLSEYLEAVANGERVLICKRNHPIAELRAVEQKRTEPRTLGGSPYQFDVPDAAFFDPMPDEFLDAFEAGPGYPDTTRPTSSMVAEPRASYGTRRSRKRSK